MKIMICLIGLLFISGCSLSNKVCIKSHIEKQYQDYTALAVATKNYGLLALSGYKDVNVCDEYTQQSPK